MSQNYFQVLTHFQCSDQIRIQGIFSTVWIRYVMEGRIIFYSVVIFAKKYAFNVKERCKEVGFSSITQPVLSFQERAFFGTVRTGGGDGFHLTPARPPTNPENQQIEYLYAHTLPLNQLTKYSVLRVVGLKETSKFDLFTKFLNQILHFWIFSKKKSELNSTHHFSPFFPKWSQQSKKKRQNDIQNFFVLGVPKVL